MDTLLQDIRFGARMLLKSKGFSVVAILALGLGIGANTAIFTLVNGVLLRPLPFPEPERIVYFEGVNRSAGITESNISAPDFNDWSQQSQAFSHMAMFVNAGAVLTGSNGQPERLPRAAVMSSFFSVLGVQPVLGRAILAEEDKLGTETVAVLGYGLWQRRFGGDPAIVGNKITVGGRSVTVVGIMPAGFDPPEGAQLWTSLPMDPADERRDNRSLSAIGRLKPGVTLAQAQSRLSAINTSLAQTYKETNSGWDVELNRLHDRLVRDIRPLLIALLGAVAFVLLIACANVANLLLTRAATRQREMAIRAALGAARIRVIRQLLTESFLLAVIGGGLGLMLSLWLTDLLTSLSPEELPGASAIHLDYRVLGFTIALTTVTGLLFGLVPALQSSKLDVSSALKESGRGSGDGQPRHRIRNLLLVSEVAFSVMLLVGTSLLIKSFLRIREVEPGFAPDHVLTVSIPLVGMKFRENQMRENLYRQVLERVEKLPGVKSAGITLSLPLGGSNYSVGRGFVPEGRPLIPEESANAMYSFASAAYFRTMGISLLAGRPFAEHENMSTPMVVIINKTMAQRVFGSIEQAVGKRITIWRDEKFSREIVGVVGDTKFSTLHRADSAQMYVPPSQDEGWGQFSLAVRTVGEPAEMSSAIRGEVSMINKDLPIYNVQTMEEIVTKSIGSRRSATFLFSVFAGAALLLAALGIYGVMAYSVTQRTQEIGIRMALGAQAGDVLRLIVGQGMSLTLVGIAVGIAGAFALSHLITSLLFGVPATDPSTFLAIPLVLLVVALIACYLPARRAARLNPTIALAQN